MSQSIPIRGRASRQPLLVAMGVLCALIFSFIFGTIAQGAILLSNDFNRPDQPSVGDFWSSQSAGIDWSTSGNKLRSVDGGISQRWGEVYQPFAGISDTKTTFEITLTKIGSNTIFDLWLKSGASRDFAVKLEGYGIRANVGTDVVTLVELHNGLAIFQATTSFDFNEGVTYLVEFSVSNDLATELRIWDATNPRPQNPPLTRAPFTLQADGTVFSLRHVGIGGSAGEFRWDNLVVSNIADPRPQPFIVNLRQLKSDGITMISEGDGTTENTVIFKAGLVSLVNNRVKLEVELRRMTEAFTGIDDGGILKSEFVSSGATVTLTKTNLLVDRYHWRARTVDTQGNASDWEEFGATENVDFSIVGTVLLRQPVDTDSSTGSWFSDNWYQLGRGTSITIRSLALKGYVDNGDYANYVSRISLQEFNDARYTSLNQTYSISENVPFVFATPKEVTFEGLNIPLRSDKFYRLFTYNQRQNASVILLGTRSFGVAMFNESVGGVGRVERIYTFYPFIVINKFNEPVIIVPGIMGSWWTKIVPNLGDLVIDPILHTYDDLIEAFADRGYLPGQDLFTFPYDWRNDNRLAALDLKDKTHEIKSICQCPKVDIVAHSMGGLVARAYIESDAYQNDIDQLILLGTPNNGSPKAYLAWEAGEEAPGKFPTLEEILFSLLAKYEGFGLNRFAYIRNRPVTSIQQLLPTYDYLKVADTNVLQPYPTSYPRNVFLDNLNSTSSLDKLAQSAVRILNIVGDKPTTEDDTINTVRVVTDPSRLPLWENGYPQNYDSLFGDNGLERGDGDGTVPLASAQALFTTNVTQITLNSEHRALAYNAWPEVFVALTGDSAIAIQPRSFVSKMLFIPVFSPVDIQIADPLGRKIGKDFETNQSLNEIPLAFYTGFESEALEFIAIPNPLDGEYTIQTRGTGSGQYEIELDYVSDNAIPHQTKFVANTQSDLDEHLRFTLSASTPEATVITPVDIEPPVIAHTPLESEYILNASSTIFEFSATDTGVGVFNISAKLDGELLTSGLPLSFNKHGRHVIEITAADFVGNIATSTITFDVVYQFSGFLPPIKPDNSGIYQKGRTLPVKFQLRDAQGNFATSAVAFLTVAKVQNGTIGTEEIPRSTSKADSGNQFRYDPVNDQYIYNLATDTMVVGTWQLKIALDDGKIYTAVIVIK